MGEKHSRLSACSARLSYSSAVLSITALVPASFTSSASLHTELAPISSRVPRWRRHYATGRFQRVPLPRTQQARPCSCSPATRRGGLQRTWCRGSAGRRTPSNDADEFHKAGRSETGAFCRTEAIGVASANCALLGDRQVGRQGGSPRHPTAAPLRSLLRQHTQTNPKRVDGLGVLFCGGGCHKFPHLGSARASPS